MRRFLPVAGANIWNVELPRQPQFARVCCVDLIEGTEPCFRPIAVIGNPVLFTLCGILQSIVVNPLGVLRDRNPSHHADEERGYKKPSHPVWFTRHIPKPP